VRWRFSSGRSIRDIVGGLARAERGFTLVELLIYSVLLILVAAIGGSLIFGSTSTTKLVRSVTDATTLGQEITKSVQRGVRNAAAIKTPYAPSLADVGIAGTQLLVIETTTGGTVSATKCQAWFYVPSHGGQLFTRTVSAGAVVPLPNVAYIAALSATAVATAPSGWQSWGEGINGSGAVPFSRSGNQIGISLSVAAGASKPVKIASSALNRQPTLGATSSCF